MYVGLDMKYQLYLSDFNGPWIFLKSANMKFNENPSSGSHVVLCGRADNHDEAKSRFS
jgi:hypothetical protein